MLSGVVEVEAGMVGQYWKDRRREGGGEGGWRSAVSREILEEEEKKAGGRECEGINVKNKQPTWYFQ